MEEQKLTMFQRNKVNYHLRNGEPLPPPRVPAREKANDYEEQLAFEIMMRAKSARKRTLDTIVATGAYKIEKYKFVRRPRILRVKKTGTEKYKWGPYVFGPPKHN